MILLKVNLSSIFPGSSGLTSSTLLELSTNDNVKYTSNSKLGVGMLVELRIKYDRVVDALYIRLKSGKIIESDERGYYETCYR